MGFCLVVAASLFVASNVFELVSAQKIVLNPKHCGVSLENRIINGRRAEEGAFPWMVRLQVHMTEGVTPATCGGTIITPWHVLTSAHCVIHDGKIFDSIEVISGSVTTTSSKAMKVRVVAAVHHERYNQSTFFNDIAILRVEKPFQYGLLVRPACLHTNETDLTGHKVIVAGWGVERAHLQASDNLRFTTIKILSQRECKKRLQEYSFNPKIMMCAYQRDKDACQGDSGSALMLKQKKSYIQVGIVSFGINCAGDLPGVYVPVAAYAQWIIDTLSHGSRFIKLKH
ncbi:trypsin alpha-3-like [Ornithodoros turicata]|uniref:trypsin alpha-3-like n=1 Tax=Ornithodoros turicata TaxID=34597 RepID=UPI00313A27D1